MIWVFGCKVNVKQFDFLDWKIGLSTQGFIHENKNTLGINHLLEHVLVNSYKNCNKNYF